MQSSSSSNGPSKLVLNYMAMGFPEAMVTKVIAELGNNSVLVSAYAYMFLHTHVISITLITFQEKVMMMQL